MWKRIVYSCLVVVVSLAFGTLGCEPPITSGESKELLSSVWTDGTKGSVSFSPDAKQLPAEAYPLELTAGPLAADSRLPTKGSAKSESFALQRGDLDNAVALKALPMAEGVVVLRNAKGEVIDQMTYIDFPKAAVLHRSPKQEQFCERATWTKDGSCKVIDRKITTTRLRAIRSPAEFKALAKISGQQGLQIQELKVLVDLERDNATHYLDSNKWSLHYTWVRQIIEKKEALDRCDKEQLIEFNNGWYAWSDINYFKTDGRRWLLATIIYYAGQNKYALEFSAGDRIKYHQLVTAWKTLRATFPKPLPMPVRPVTTEQHDELFHTNADKIPLMPIDEPYQGQNVQLLSPGVAYGILTALSKTEVATHSLGLRTIAVLKDVPNDINFVGGIISTNFQSSLSHINVLSRNRGTPHLVLKDAVTSKDTKALFGKLVRLEVTSSGYTLKAADQKEAEAFWKERAGVHKPWTPKANTTRKELFDLKDATYKDSLTIGAKAANMAEMAKISITKAWHGSCRQFDNEGLVPIPATPFGIPFYWYVDHIEKAGYKDKIKAWHLETKFLEDAAYRREKLQELRDAIDKTPVNPELLKLVALEIKSRFDGIKVRFRSSTNVEDLPNFNGAGLYTSKSYHPNHATKTISAALRTVWASLWADRAWNERHFYKIDHTFAAMAILVHPSFPDEAANGVAISGNIFNPTDGTDTYIAVQKGELSVVNPETNDAPDQFLLRWFESIETIFLSYSTLNDGKPILSSKERNLLGCYMQAIDSYFRPIFAEEGKPFAMDVEFKIDKSPRKLFIKQARPYIFGEHQGTANSCKKP